MRKTYDIDVDCANCANLAENAASKVDGVSSVAVNFMMQKMTVDFDEGSDEKSVMKAIKRACRKVEPDFDIEF